VYPSVLLDLGYLVAFVVLSPWIAWKLGLPRAWREARMRFGFGLGAGAGQSVWLHGSSVGEITVLRPLVELLERNQPGTPLVISAFTSTGLAAARRLYPRHRVVPFPMDFSPVARRCLRHFDPRLVIIVESEFWPNFISVARRRGVPVVCINGKMSSKSARLHARTGLVPHVLRDLSLIAVQTAEHAGRLRALGVETRRIKVTGNMKYDLPRPAARNGAPGLRAALGYGPDDIVVIGGSLHEQEDEALLDAYRALPAAASKSGLIIVPRYPADADRVERHVRARGLYAVRKTVVDAGRSGPRGAGAVLIVDTLGDLVTLYGVADVAFVGGSLFYRGSNKGGHNLMEPAALALPVLFGPYNFSFKETVDDLLAADAGVLVRDAAELAAALADLIADGDRRRDLGERARDVMLERRGATQRNYDLIVELLARREERLQPRLSGRKMPRAAGGADTS
jgi:3-deoxy-D-manno-octulosonic-acid transferase